MVTDVKGLVWGNLTFPQPSFMVYQVLISYTLNTCIVVRLRNQISITLHAIFFQMD